MSQLHCWHECPDDPSDGMSTTCMLIADHDGDHVPTRDDEITIAFAPEEVAA